MQEPPINKIQWNNSSRIIPSRFPPIDLFERVSQADDWEKLCELESLTNPRIREQAGQISLVPENRRISGVGATYVMAAFTHLNKMGSRFSNGTFGIYYAAKTLKTAHIETISRMERFYNATKEDRIANDFRALTGKISASFHDIRGGETSWQPYYKPDDWTASQKLGVDLRNKESNGILYNSVRHEGGECVAALWPDTVGIPKQAGHFKYHWNGARIDKCYDFEKQEWWNT
jgi:hypothetical protein